MVTIQLRRYWISVLLIGLAIPLTFAIQPLFAGGAPLIFFTRLGSLIENKNFKRTGGIRLIA